MSFWECPGELKLASMISTRIFLTLTALLSLAASQLPAQTEGNGFLFGQPKGSIAVRGGLAAASGAGDLFSFTDKQLTLNRGDFTSPNADLDLALRLSTQTDIVFSLSYAGTTKASEFRDFVDQSNNSIRQSTVFQRVPAMIGVRQYLTTRGRSVGELAWIPSRLAPYVGIAGGAMWYRFHQTGDFVDFKTNDVFNGTLSSSGLAPAASAAAGVDVTLTPRFALTGQGNYMWARARPGGDFAGFSRIDLSGLSTTVGLRVRF